MQYSHTLSYICNLCMLTVAFNSYFRFNIDYSTPWVILKSTYPHPFSTRKIDKGSILNCIPYPNG